MAVTEEIKEQLLNRSGGWCECTLERCSHGNRRCGKMLMPSYWHAYHIVPIVSGGTDDLGNLIAMCSECYKNTGRL